MMLFVSFCGIVLCPIAVRMKQAHDQRSALAELRKCGAKVYYDYQLDDDNAPVAFPQPLDWQWLRPVMGDDYFDHVVWVNVDHRKKDTEVIGHVAKLPALRGLSLPLQPIDGSSLASLSRLGELQFLDLQFTQVGDNGLEHLACLEQLEWLGLHGTNVSDQELGRLRGLKRLKTIVLSGTNVTQRGREMLQRHLPDCQIY